MSQDPRVKKKMAATTATARRRMTTTRAALSAITAGVWSMHSGQGPAWGEGQQHAEQRGEMRPSEGEVSVLVHDKWSTQLMQGSEADHRRNHSRGVWWTGLPSGVKTNQRLWMMINHTQSRLLMSVDLWDSKTIGLERRWYHWELNLWLNYACNPPLSQKQHTTSMHAFRSLMTGCLHDKYYRVACVASSHITQHSALSTEATTTFLMSVCLGSLWAGGNVVKTSL